MADPSGKVLDMKIINEIYRRIPPSNGKNEASTNRNYKKHVKELISKNVCGISFVKSKNPSKPDQLISDSTTSETLDTSIKECTRYGKLLKLSAVNCCKETNGVLLDRLTILLYHLYLQHEVDTDW